MTGQSFKLPIEIPDPVLSEPDFHFFSAMIKEIAGIHITLPKKALIHSRLRRRLIELGLSGFDAYRDLLANLPREDPEWQNFVNLLTTNKTDFFREKEHFEFLRDCFAKKNALGKPIRIWCAASSTGEEPYTLAAVAHQTLTIPFEILATDIDTKVLGFAARAVYPADRLREIPDGYRKSCFDIGTKEISAWMRVKPEVKEKVSFAAHNLIEPVLPEGEPFDFIFCRNVLIYFTPETCGEVGKKLYAAGAPGALFFIGHAESLQKVPGSWSSVRPSVYLKRG